ncbi:MAG: hypothetical protein AAF849_15335 [Bacteroidota bacterium]
MKYITSLLLLFFFYNSSAQIDTVFTQALFDLLEKEAYQEVIERTNNRDSLSETDKYYRGYSFLLLEQEDRALELFDEVIASDSNSTGSRYLKSAIHFGRKEFDIALSTINDAIQVDATDADFYALRSEIYYYKDQTANAIADLEQCVALRDSSVSNYMNLASLYFEEDQLDKAAKTYLAVEQFISPKHELFDDYTYSSGLTAFLRADYQLAAKRFEVLHGKRESPFLTALLIQTYYQLEKYEAGNALKPVLYKAWEAGTLPDDIKNDFVLEEFEWKGQKIRVYERFDESKDRILFYKHVFYLFNEAGNMTTTIQTEWSGALDTSDKEYVLGKSVFDPATGNKLAHYSYFSHVFDKEVDYKALKNAVIGVLEGKIDPSSSSSFGTPSTDVPSKKRKKRKRKKKKKQVKKI